MAATDDLAARVRRLEDIAALERLAKDYCIGADTQDAQRWADVWTDDAVWRVGEDDEHIFRGREAICAAVEAQWRTFPRMQHASSNHVVDLTHGNQARGRSDVVVIVQLPDRQWLIGGGSYLDEYRRDQSRWRISDRRVVAPFDLQPLAGSTSPTIVAPGS